MNMIAIVNKHKLLHEFDMEIINKLHQVLIYCSKEEEKEVQRCLVLINVGVV